MNSHRPLFRRTSTQQPLSFRLRSVNYVIIAFWYKDFDRHLNNNGDLEYFFMFFIGKYAYYSK